VEGAEPVGRYALPVEGSFRTGSQGDKACFFPAQGRKRGEAKGVWGLAVFLREEYRRQDVSRGGEGSEREQKHEGRVKRSAGERRKYYRVVDSSLNVRGGNSPGGGGTRNLHKQSIV